MSEPPKPTASISGKSPSLFDITIPSSPPTDRPITLFIDTCIPIGIVSRLEPLLRGRPENPTLIHLNDRFPPDTHDDVWAIECRKNNWLPITRDRGARNKGPKLSRVCASIGLVHVVIAPKVGDQPVAELSRAIATVWPAIVAAWRKPECLRYSLRRSNELTYTLAPTKDPMPLRHFKLPA